MRAVKSQHVIDFRSALSDYGLGLFWKSFIWRKPWIILQNHWIFKTTRIQQVLLPVFVYIILNAFTSVVFEFSFQKLAQFWSTPSGTVPLWWRAPAPADPPSFARPAWRGGSCSDSGGQTLTPAGLEEHKGQRGKTSHDPWKRIIAMGDVVACSKGWVWKLFKWISITGLVINHRYLWA